MRKARLVKKDELRPEYRRSDFGELVRGKYAERIARSTNVVILEPEVAAAFPNDEAVNGALKSLLHLAQSTAPKARQRAKPTARSAAS